MTNWSQVTGWFAIVTGTLIFSTGSIIIRNIDIPPLAIAFWTQVVSTAVLIAWKWPLLKQYPVLLQDRNLLYRFLALGVLVAIDRLAFTTAVWMAPVAKVLVVAYLFPIHTMLLASRVLNEPITARMMMAGLTALIGIVVLVFPELGPTTVGELPGLILAGVVSLAVAANRILLKGVDPSIPTGFILLAESVVATLTLAPFAIMATPPLVSFQTIALILVSGAFHGVIAHAVVMSALRILPAGPAAIVSYVEPVAATLLAWWLLSEVISPFTLVGGILILTGSLNAMLSQTNQILTAGRYNKIKETS